MGVAYSFIRNAMKSQEPSQNFGSQFAAVCRAELAYLGAHDIAVEPYAELEDYLKAVGDISSFGQRKGNIDEALSHILHLNHRWAHLPNLVRHAIKPQRRIQAVFIEVLDLEERLLKLLNRAQRDRTVSDALLHAVSLFAKENQTERSASRILEEFNSAGPSKRNRLLVNALRLRSGVWAAFERSYPFEGFPRADLTSVARFEPFPNPLCPWKSLNRRGVEKALCRQILDMAQGLEEASHRLSSGN